MNGNCYRESTAIVAYAIALDAQETVRIALENRIRQLTNTKPDSRGYLGPRLPIDDPIVVSLQEGLDVVSEEEGTYGKLLEKAVKQHPLATWVETRKGIGFKQGGRLIAAFGGDPSWNTLHDRPRTEDEMIAYAGYGTVADGVYRRARKRTRGVRSNWSPEVKMRAFLCSVSCLKSKGPFETVYRERRAETEGKNHDMTCVRCGPQGHPALPGSPWSAGHQHADALRMTSKAILRDLWKYSRDLH